MAAPLLLALVLAGPAWARCTLAALETRVDRGAEGTLRRTDRWTWRVEGAPAACATVDLASPAAAPIADLRVEVQRVDGRDPRVGPERIEAVAEAADPGFGPAPGLRVHAPELAAGDLLLVEVDRTWPAAGEGFAWNPGARGALEIATLDHPADLDLRLDLPHAPPVALGTRRLLTLEGVPAGAPELSADPPPAARPVRSQGRVIALLLPPRRPLRALGDPDDSARLEAATQEGGAPFRVAPPRDALLRWCRAGGADCPWEGGVAWRVDPAEGAAWGWVRPGTWPSGEVDLGPATASRVVVLAPDGALALAGPPEARPLDLRTVDLPALLGLEALPEGLAARLAASAPLASSAQLWMREGAGAARPSWRVAALDGAPVLGDPRDAVGLAARLALRASIPEPALPVDLKGRREDPSALPEVLAALRARMHPGHLPDAPPLQPRSLQRARRSGWGSPWELALVLSRFLGQLRFEADPVLVQPAPAGPPDPASASAWTDAVVRLRGPEGALWLDPTCGSCPPGQLLPRLDEAWVLAPGGPARLPALPPSTWRRVRGPEGVVVEVGGPLATALREELLAVAPEARGPGLARALGGEGAALVEHVGLVSADAPLRLVLDAPGPLPPPALDLAPGLGGSAWLPVRGTWVEEGPLPPGAAAEAVVVEAEGLRWTRGPTPEGTWREELEVRTRQVDAAAARALLGRLAASWGRPLP